MVEGHCIAGYYFITIFVLVNYCVRVTTDSSCWLFEIFQVLLNLFQRLKLTRMLVGITDHHHNNAHIAELLPPGARGMFIQRGFCYLVLSEILLDRTNVSDELLNSIKVGDIHLLTLF
jgi:hypothetical protein